jgi:hypothetical protein
VLHWIIAAVPVAVFCKVAYVVGTQGFAPFKALAWFIVAVLIALTLQGMYYLVRVWLASWVPPLKLIAGTKDALAMAFSTASSTVTMPVTYACLREKVGLREESASLGALVGSNFNNDGTALYEAMAALFIAQMTGTELSLAQQAMVVLTSVVASVGAAGIPEAGLVTMTLVFPRCNLPTSYIALLLPVDWFLDRCRTAINVMGDMNVSCILDGNTPEARRITIRAGGHRLAPRGAAARSEMHQGRGPTRRPSPCPAARCSQKDAETGRPADLRSAGAAASAPSRQSRENRHRLVSRPGPRSCCRVAFGLVEATDVGRPRIVADVVAELVPVAVDVGPVVRCKSAEHVEVDAVVEAGVVEKVQPADVVVGIKTVGAVSDGQAEANDVSRDGVGSSSAGVAPYPPALKPLPSPSRCPFSLVPLYIDQQCSKVTGSRALMQSYPSSLLNQARLAAKDVAGAPSCG